MRRKPVEEWEERTDTICLLDWANSYLTFSEVRHVEKTFKEKRRTFKTFFSSVNPHLTVDELTPSDVLIYVQTQKKIRSGYAANKDRKNLVAGWNWGMKYMNPPLPGPNPCDVEKMPEKRHPRYIPPERDFWKVYETAQGQDKVILTACLHLAARKGELFRLHWDDVDFGEERVRLFTRKRKGGTLESNWLPMTDELFNVLLSHRQVTDSEWVFVNLITGRPFVERKRWMGVLCKKAGVKPFGLHAIRHLTASILAKDGVAAIKIQGVLRHKKLSTTERYLHQLGGLKTALQVLSKKKKPSGEPSFPQTVCRKIIAVA
jgi:integrase